MDYSRILDDLNSATLFDLFRLSVAIEQQLDDPKRIEEVRVKLRPGMEITFFAGDRNHLVNARVLKLNRTRLDVHNLLDHRDWSIRYCTVNLENVETDIIKPTKTLGISRTELKIGDAVGFCDKQNQEQYGRVIALNQKTASILVNEREKWRVAYSFLFPIIEGAVIEQQ